MKQKRIRQKEFCVHCLEPTDCPWGVTLDPKNIGPLLPLCESCGVDGAIPARAIRKLVHDRTKALLGLQPSNSKAWLDCEKLVCVYCQAHDPDYNAQGWHFFKAENTDAIGPVGVCPKCAESKTCSGIAIYVQRLRASLGVTP